MESKVELVKSAICGNCRLKGVLFSMASDTCEHCAIDFERATKALYNSPTPKAETQQVVCPKSDNCWGCQFADITNRLCTLLKEVKNEIGIIHTNDVPKWCPVPSTPEPEQVVCPKCGGDGHWFLPIMGTTKVCTNCNGTGKVPVTPTSEKYYWWCPNCKEEKSSIQVTYGENCTECGGRVESLPVPQTLSEGMLLKEQQIDHEFEKYPMLKKCGVTLYCCIMDILRLQLAKVIPLIEAPLRAEIETLNLVLMNRKSEIVNLQARIKELEQQLNVSSLRQARLVRKSGKGKE